MKYLFLSALFVSTVFSCKKEDNDPYNSSKKAALSVEFDNIVGGADLQLGTGSYSNASGENFTVNKLLYFVSNFKLTRADGSVYTVPQDSCYFLIDESKETTHEPVLQVPEGEYNAISFMVGVDSLRNTMDVSKRTGDLDIAGAAAGMYWSWNSGYIFFKMEGTSPASAESGNAFQYHVGLFGGYATPTLNNTRLVTLDLTARGTPKVKTGKQTNIHLMVDVLNIFNGSTKMSIAAHPIEMTSAFTANIANNYAAMFRHDHTEN